MRQVVARERLKSLSSLWLWLFSLCTVRVHSVYMVSYGYEKYISINFNYITSKCGLKKLVKLCVWKHQLEPWNGKANVVQCSFYLIFFFFFKQIRSKCLLVYAVADRYKQCLASTHLNTLDKLHVLSSM